MQQTIIITGASGNMGQAVVRKFIAEGYQVIGAIPPGDKVPLEINSDKFEKITADLMDENAAGELISNITAKYHSIDVAVLTVGGFAMGKIADTKTSDIYKQYQLNFETAYNVARPAFEAMVKQNGGRIFLVGSRPGLDAKSGKGMIAYGLAKSLIFRLAELMNEEGKEHNVVVSVLVPSTIDTPQNRKSMPDADHSGWVTPEQIADAVYFYSGKTASALREPVIKLYNQA